MNKGIKKFEIDTKELSQTEKVLFNKLILASELLASVYLKQKNSRYIGSNFYPPDASKEEIQKAADKDPAILDPYTIVERDGQDNLRAVYFHVKFKKELEEISKILKQAALLCKDPDFKNYLIQRAEDLLTDNYDKSNILWLKTEKHKIGFVIGPFDRYLDKLFFKKRAYMSWIGILDEKQTRMAKKFSAATLATEKKYLPGAKRTKIPRIRVRVEKTALFSGLIADFMFAGNNLPSSADIYLTKKYGTLFTIFSPIIKYRFENWIFPIFEEIFEKKIKKKYFKEELYKSFLTSIILHETCHSLMRYEDATFRLQEFFPFFDELYTDILGLKGSGNLLLKDALSQKELEALLLICICRHLHWISHVKAQPQLIHYAVGGAVSLNFLLQGEVFKKKKEKYTITDFGKLFICFDQLSYILDYYMALGNYNEAKEFIAKYGSFENFQRDFLPKLEKVLKNILID